VEAEFLQCRELIARDLVCNVVAPLRVCELVQGFELVCVAGDMM
jgi:hypothetical protein